ncbi:MAG: coproporphyrinogen dehydrogenase HemZ [Lachnospiraceae bacterium]|nr:coproporphyrinogen dehydrogenase HemZ [Lachnospiraceae bacterium]
MIRVLFNKDRYFYDVHSLVKAFYPGEDVKCLVMRDDEAASPADPADISVILDEENGLIKIEFTDSAGVRILKSAACRKNDGTGDQSSIDITPVRDEDGNRIYNAKNTLKRILYEALTEKTGRTLPWGSLTGIRPTHIPGVLMEAGLTDDAIMSEMRNTYFASEKKAALAMEIAKREREILSGTDYASGYSLYMGIPFCPTTCLYCSFPSYPAGAWQNRIDEYLRILFKEMEHASRMFENKKLYSVYVGGGTPTALSAEQLDELLSRLQSLFDMSYVQELTVEAGRPDSITEAKLKTLSVHGVDRISINPQTMQQRTLDLIGRRHSAKDTVSAFRLARASGDFKINTDLILGLPGENASDVRDTLEKISALKPDDLTIHALAVKRGSRMHAMMQTKGAVYPGFEDMEEAARIAEESARGMGLVPYYLYRQKNIAGNFENTGYAAPGAHGLYNILINEDIHSIVALGAGAISKCVCGNVIERSENVKDLGQYLERSDEMLERKEKLFERIL